MKKSALALGVALVGVLALDCALAEPSAAQCASSAPPRPVHRTYIRRDVQEPGVYAVTRTPAQYGWVTVNGEPRRILLRPYKNIAHFQPPYISWYREHLTILPEIFDPDC
ncbi:MAG: hypothetical protein ACLPX9_00605 [Rhodomicrobium sp.]